MFCRSVSLNRRGTCGRVRRVRGGTRKAAGSSTSVPFQWISPASGGSKPEEGPQEGRLARADAPGDHRQGAARQAQVDLDDAAPGLGVAIGQAGGRDASAGAATVAFSRRRRQPGSGPRRWSGVGATSAVAGASPSRVSMRCERDAGLPELGQVLAQPGGEIGDEAQVGDEQDEVAHRQAAVAQLAGGQQHDQPGADP